MLPRKQRFDALQLPEALQVPEGRVQRGHGFQTASAQLLHLRPPAEKDTSVINSPGEGEDFVFRALKCPLIPGLFHRFVEYGELFVPQRLQRTKHGLVEARFGVLTPVKARQSCRDSDRLMDDCTTPSTACSHLSASSQSHCVFLQAA